MFRGFDLVKSVSTREQSRDRACFLERRRLVVVAWNEGALGAHSYFQGWVMIRVLAAQRRENRKQSKEVGKQ